MLTLAAEHRHEVEIKKSRFIAVVFRARSVEEAFAGLEGVSQAKATHNCWAYRIGDLYRFSDDGEPGGTAGRPILAAIEGQGLDQVMAVVIRYFGGIKLGAGGLVRAYGGCVAQCLRQAPRLEITPKVVCSVEVPFELTGTVYQLLERQGVSRLDEEYSTTGSTLTLQLEEEDFESFCQALRDATRARCAPVVLAEESES
jgi:uncharacterized YigZ family protein